MSYVSIPTDSVYKFIAISGLILLLAPLWHLTEVEGQCSDQFNRAGDEIENRYRTLTASTLTYSTSELLASFKSTYRVFDIAGATITEEEKKEDIEEVEDFEDLLHHYIAIPQPDDKGMKKWWMDRISCTEQEYLQICNEAATSEEWKLVRAESKKLLMMKPVMFTLKATQWEALEVITWWRRRCYSVCIVGLFLFAWGLRIWHARVQQPQDKLIRYQVEKAAKEVASN